MDSMVDDLPVAMFNYELHLGKEEGSKQRCIFSDAAIFPIDLNWN